MRIEIYTLHANTLICNYTDYSGKQGTKEFTLKGNFSHGLIFEQLGTHYKLAGVRWCNLNKCYTATYNNTKLTGFIECDLSTLYN